MRPADPLILTDTAKGVGPYPDLFTERRMAPLALPRRRVATFSALPIFHVFWGGRDGKLRID